MAHRNNAIQDIVAAVDIGHSKIACCIAKNKANGLEILGIGYQEAKGIENGIVTDLQKLSKSIAYAVHAAEQNAGEVIRGVFVGINTHNIISEILVNRLEIPERPITNDDINKLNNLEEANKNKDYTTLHKIPAYYCLDDSVGISDPLGMIGTNFEVYTHHVALPSSYVKNIILAIEKCHLDVFGVVFSPLVLEESVLTPEEIELGTTLIDFGAYHTSVNLIYKGAVVHTEVVPLGGFHITNDIAHGFSTPLAVAERIKVLYGHIGASNSIGEANELFEIPQIGTDSNYNTVSRSALNSIIQARIEEIIEIIFKRLQEKDYTNLVGNHMVICGGGSQLNGLNEKLQFMLHKSVRTIKKLPVEGHYKNYDIYALGGAIGVMKYATKVMHQKMNNNKKGFFNSVKRWFRGKEAKVS